jgi:hypothetical protein
MKLKFSSRCSFSNPRLLIGLSFVLLSASLALVGLGAISKGSDATRDSTGSLQTATTTARPQSHSNDVALRSSHDGRLDENGNRPNGIKSEAAMGAKHRGDRPVGNGAWVSLGPPGGDVFDAAASTVNTNIVLAGLAPDGSFGGRPTPRPRPTPPG